MVTSHQGDDKPSFFISLLVPPAFGLGVEVQEPSWGPCVSDFHPCPAQRDSLAFLGGFLGSWHQNAVAEEIFCVLLQAAEEDEDFPLAQSRAGSLTPLSPGQPQGGVNWGHFWGSVLSEEPSDPLEVLPEGSLGLCSLQLLKIHWPWLKTEITGQQKEWKSPKNPSHPRAEHRVMTTVSGDLTREGDTPNNC